MRELKDIKNVGYDYEITILEYNENCKKYIVSVFDISEMESVEQINCDTLEEAEKRFNEMIHKYANRLEVSPDTATMIIETREPLVNCYCIENGKYIGIFNEDGNAWTEEFDNYDSMISWLFDIEIEQTEG